jgi:hypothetical protein
MSITFHVKPTYSTQYLATAKSVYGYSNRVFVESFRKKSSRTSRSACACRTMNLVFQNYRGKYCNRERYIQITEQLLNYT